jgi:dephospho-CoA kinase
VKIIGVTGPSGAGKSTLTGIWARLGAVILDADEIYRETLNADAGIRDEISARFPGVFVEDGLDRRRLASIVFNDGKALDDLNAITHKYVLKETHRRVALERGRGTAVCVIEAIYLLEAGVDRICDSTVAVVCPAGQRVKRLIGRDGLDEGQVLARVNNQKSDAYYAERCDVSIENTGDQDSFSQSARALYTRLTGA